jgi:hypothetical protein
MKGSHKMAIEKVSIAIKGGKQKREKKGGGGGERHCGNQKVFGCHMGMAIERFSIAKQL